MKIVMGPVLGFQGVVDAGGAAPLWRVGVLVVVRGDETPVVTATGAAVSGPVLLMTHAGHRAGRATHRVLRYDLEAPQGAAPLTVTYQVEGGDEHAFHVPAAARTPRIAFASCNGFSDPKLMKQVDQNNERWSHMAGLHAQAPYHLLVLGGDQVYADEIWGQEPFRSWAERPRKARLERSFNKRKSPVTLATHDTYAAVNATGRSASGRRGRRPRRGDVRPDRRRTSRRCVAGT